MSIEDVNWFSEIFFWFLQYFLPVLSNFVLFKVFFFFLFIHPGTVKSLSNLVLSANRLGV